MILNNCRKLISLPLIIAGLVMILGLPKAEAAQLKDIRIGEYEGFTRIVFELNTTVNAPSIQPQSSGGLSVSFGDTQPDLNRKIPVERSQHVKELKILHRNNRLSIIFRFDFEHFRSETFPLEDPPRIAVDIYPLAARIERPAGNKTTMDASTEAEVLAPPAQEIASHSESEKIQDEEDSEFSPAVRDESPTRKQPREQAVKLESKPRQPSLKKSPTTPTVYQPPQVTAGKNLARAQTKTNRLQFYLVIALVVITIIILALLLLMLIARHRWANDKDVPDVNDYLKDQDQRIASLNARIQEQLKRYEEA